MSHPLKRYQEKRNLSQSSEPKAVISSKKKKMPLFVVQKHAATHLHYDFRLEVDGVLKSWAVPKGISRKIGEKRLAVHVEDHPLAYATFSGTIPEGNYGAGKVTIWDKGTYEIPNEKSIRSALRKGRLVVYLHGKKLKGPHALIRMQGKNWLLFKMKKLDA